MLFTDRTPSASTPDTTFRFLILLTGAQILSLDWNTPRLGPGGGLVFLLGAELCTDGIKVPLLSDIPLAGLLFVRTSLRERRQCEPRRTTNHQRLFQVLAGTIILGIHLDGLVSWVSRFYSYGSGVLK